MTLMRCQEKYRFYEKTDLFKFEAFSRVQPGFFFDNKRDLFQDDAR